jgi:translocation and assembly module TamB
MADAAPDVVVVRRPLWARALRWLLVALLALAVLVGAVLLGINTSPGRRFVADQIGGYTTATGLNIQVGRIEGSIYGRMTLRDLRVRDQRGVFLTSPAVEVDWRPFAYLRNHIDVRSLRSGLVTLQRNPEFKPTPPSDETAPILPDLDIDVNRLAVERFVTELPVAGQRHVARIVGEAHIADRRAQLVVDADALTAPGVAGGDRARVRIDAVPDDDRLALDVRLTAPTGGLVAGLAGLKAPLALTLGGQGSWSDWRGRLTSRLGAGELANLALTARDGRFSVRGLTRPGLYLQGPVERLTAPGLQVAVDAALAERRIDTRFSLRSDALAVAGNGLIDLATSRFRDLKVGADLLTPGAIAPNLNGRNVHAQVALDGPFGTPTVDYKLVADRIGFGEMAVERVYAEGLARVDADRILLPVNARAARVVGLNAAAGGLLTNVAINGDLAWSNGSLLSDNLRLRSDRIDATAIVAANMTTGRYTGALKGRVNDYRIDGIGIVSLTTDARLVPGRNGGFGIAGRVVARTSRIFNEGARTFLGGQAIVRSDVGYSPEGVVTFSGLRVSAPAFRVTRGEGLFDPASGRVLVSADAWSRQYGPLFARVTGSAAAPVVALRAPRPGVGIGLANLDARIVGRGGGYAVTATGGTNYGPFSADVLVRPGGQLAVDVRRVLFAGVTFAGRIVQTAAGPFAGRLGFNGSGLTGQVALAAQGRYQRADVAARAYQAAIPGAGDIRIGRAIVNASVVLLPNAPQVVADAQVADLRYGPTVLSAARARVNYVGGRGSAQALFTGANGVPFRLAVNARLSPAEYLVALQGEANRIGFRTGNPARITAARGTYRLYPTRVVFDQGSARIAGTYGRGISAQARLDSLDLGMLNALVPNLGIGGRATASVDFTLPAAGGMPRATFGGTVAGFQRTSLAAVSQPVDLAFTGNLADAGAELRALVRRGATPVGRVLATLRPAGAGPWTSRLLAGPLGGGIRYNGPAGVLFSLAGLANQQVAGPIAIAADFGGRVQAPQVTGLIRADNLTYDNETYGTHLTQLRVAGRFTQDRFTLEALTARAGEGTVSAQGTVGLAAASGFPVDLRASLRNARLARSDALGATATGDIRVLNGPGGGSITGEIRIPEARYEIIRQGSAEVPELTGVRRKSDLNRAGYQAPTRAASAGAFRLDLRIRADNRIYVSGMGLESEWQTDLRVGGTSAAPTVAGRLQVVRGTFSFAGKRFDLSRGLVTFRGGALTDPDIDIQATTTANGITAIINIGGTGQRPRITFTSTPAMAQDEVLSRLLFGADPSNLSATEAIQLAAALNSLRGSGGGLNPLGKLRSATGFDRLRVLGADEASGRGTSLAAGKYLTDDIYIEIITDARGYTATQLTVALTKSLSVLSQAGSFGGSNASIRYSKDY